MAKEKNRYTIGCGDINPVINLIVEGSLRTQIVGEPVDLTGVTIYALHYNGKKENVTNKVRLSRSNWSDTEGKQSVDIGYKGRRITLTANVSEVMLDSISVKTPPTKTAYRIGETIDMTGLVLTASFNDGTSVDVTEGYTFAPATMASDTTKVTISYTVEEVTKTVEQPITLISLDSIVVKTPPTKTSYKVGETISATGLVLTATYTDGSSEDVTEGYTFTPVTMASDTTAMTISLEVDGITKTTTQVLTLVSLDSISVKTPPTVTSFAAGADIDLTGLVLTATYTDGSTADVTQGYTFSPTVMANDTTSVTISYTENGVTKTTTQAVSLITNRKKVGGILFYIDSTADGTYTFYNGEGTQVSAPTVGTDCTDWEYEVTGASKDKYYVVYNELYTSKRWCPYIDGAYVNVSTGYTATAIGSGKTNTAGIMAIDNGKYIQADSNGYPTVWYQIQQMRTNKVGGCDDWFVGSEYELDALRTSNAGDSATWFSGNYIWSSSDYSANYARTWSYNNSNWSNDIKYGNACVCGVRAF